ncbi:MAG: methyltransferase type 12 [Marmoricola sp.]|nr:methyltransferase type 12 [Marmoricola sp.]
MSEQGQTSGHPMHDQGSDRWSAEFWDDRYRSKPALWSGNANAVVMTETADLPAGRALDVGCGEGGDALWLAGRGWQVLGIDVSQVALERARGHADVAGPEISGRTAWEWRDLLSWTPPAASYDLVSVPFLHLPSALRVPVYAGLAAAVAPGGTLLVVAHHPSDIGVVPRPPEPDLFFTEEDLAAELDDGWEVVTCEARSRAGSHPDGYDVTLHDTVLRAVRRPTR